MMRFMATLLLFLAGQATAEPGLRWITGDLTGNGEHELALISTGDGISLAIYANSGGPPLAQSTGIIWPGQINEGPSVEITPQGSLRITTSNFGIGRHKWEMAVIVAYRNDEFVVAGLTYNAFDTLEQDSFLRCDVNLLNGRGTRETAAGTSKIRIAEPPVSVNDWTEDNPGSVCDIS